MFYMKRNKRTINRSLGKKRRKRFKNVEDRDQYMIPLLAGIKHGKKHEDVTK